MNHAFTMDPYEILGVTQESSLEAIRDAYRTKSKRYHPDVGGDAWAFRILTQAYEVLSARRVMSRAASESPPPPPPTPRSTPPPFRPSRPFDPDAVAEGGRLGHRDSGVAPERLVGVEVLLIRYEHDDPLAMMMEAPEDRNLSCTLNLLWPMLGAPEPSPSEFLRLREGLEAAFQATVTATRPVGQRLRITSRGRMSGMLGYPSAQAASAAVVALQEALHREGMGLVETVREVMVPRDWS